MPKNHVLKRGTMFNLASYEPMAMIDSMDGHKVVVVSNESSHFLLAIQTNENWQLSTRESNMAEFVSSFPYIVSGIQEEERLRGAYREALDAAVDYAVSH